MIRKVIRLKSGSTLICFTSTHTSTSQSMIWQSLQIDPVTASKMPFNELHLLFEFVFPQLLRYTRYRLLINLAISRSFAFDPCVPTGREISAITPSGNLKDTSLCMFIVCSEAAPLRRGLLLSAFKLPPLNTCDKYKSLLVLLFCYIFELCDLSLALLVRVCEPERIRQLNSIRNEIEPKLFE